MDQSKFNLWRACFSFCFIDGFLSTEEDLWIKDKIKTLKFTEEQRSTLLRDLKSPPNIDELLPLITKPADKGFLINSMRMIAPLDKNLSTKERAQIGSTLNAVMKKIDMESLEKDLKSVESQPRVTNKLSYVSEIVERLRKI